jgi:hypothetical protein
MFKFFSNLQIFINVSLKFFLEFSRDFFALFKNNDKNKFHELFKLIDKIKKRFLKIKKTFITIFMI